MNCVENAILVSSPLDVAKTLRQHSRLAILISNGSIVHLLHKKGAINFLNEIPKSRQNLCSHVEKLQCPIYYSLDEVEFLRRCSRDALTIQRIQCNKIIVKLVFLLAQCIQKSYSL